MDRIAYPNIVCTEDVLCGSPRIEGRRLAVGDVVCQLGLSNSGEEIEENYALTKDLILQALEYCAKQQCIQDQPLLFCHNCSLRKAQEEPLDLNQYEEFEFNGETYVRGDDSIYLGTLSEFIADWNGIDRWEQAIELLVQYGKDLIKKNP
jgi:uncharacterized protein (DUF433 family)